VVKGIACCSSKAVQKGGSVSDTEDIRVDKMLEAFFVTQRQKRQPFEDARIGLRYPLLRLSLLGLSQRDVKELAELGQAVMKEGDVREAAKRIGERRGASPLAVVIAGIVHNAEKRDEREVMLGAIFGAFAGLESRRMKEAVLGAIGGALAATTYSELQKHLKDAEVSWQDWSEVE
jgi:hypothetical protein